MTVDGLTALITDYLALLADSDIPDPVRAEVSIGAILLDLYDLLGADEDQMHPEVRALLAVAVTAA